MSYKMIETSLLNLMIIHVLIVFHYLEIINSGILIAFLYIMNISLSVILREHFSYLECCYLKLSMMKQVHESLDYEEPAKFEIAAKPNLYIQRWRRKFLNSPIQFPLDRLAFLTAKYYSCPKVTKVQVQNSHLKQLVAKDDYKPHDDYEDDLHPIKMVNDLSTPYIHRRAYLYRKRQTTIFDRKQTTAHRKKKIAMDAILQEFQDTFPPSSSDDSENFESEEKQENTQYPSTEVESNSNLNEQPRKQSIWKKLSGVFKRRSSTLAIEDNQTDYEEDSSAAE